MTVTLDLEPDQIEALTHHPNADADEIEAALRRLIAAQPTKPEEREQSEPIVLSEKQKAAIALLRSWSEEEATPEERAQNDAEYEEFKANINRWRAEEGRAPAYP